jgi:uncharacterized membrane-anchored protein
VTGDILKWLYDLPTGALMRDVAFMFPMMETLHFLGLSTLVGSIAIVDLRILGVGRAMPFEPMLRLIPLAIAGLVINIVSGFFMFTTDPYMYWPNPAFRIKMVLVLIAAANALWFMYAEQRKIAALDSEKRPDTSVRIVALISIILWVLIILLGRLLPTYEGASSIFDIFISYE